MQIDQEYKRNEEEERTARLIEQFEKEAKRERKEDDENCKHGYGSGVGRNYSPASKKRYKQIKPYF